MTPASLLSTDSLMSATKLTDLATRILRSNPVDDAEQKRILRVLNEVRNSVSGSSEQQPVVEYLDAATLLISYLAHMGQIGGSEVRSVVARLIETAAKVATDGPGAVQSLQAHEAAAAATTALDETLLEQSKSPAPSPQPQAAPTPMSTSVRVISDMMLGEIMVRMGHLQSEQIEKVLEVQRQTGLKFGESLVKLGLATWEQVQAGLRYQDGCRQVVENFTDTRTQDGTPQEQSAASPAGAPKELELNQSKLDVAGPKADMSLMSDVLLGGILIERGIISKAQLEQGLTTQRATGMRIGEALVNLGFCGWDKVEMGVRIQGQRRKYQAGG
jgi:hypothetical protein